ncbi:MAG: SCO family protein [bacterium]
MRFLFYIFFLFFSVLCHFKEGLAAETLPVELEGVGVEEHLGNEISQDLSFKDEQGQTVKLKDFFDGKRPVLLTLVYYECPNLCNFLLNGLNEGLQKMNWTVGNQFQIVTVSINPEETPELALKKKAAYLKEYGRPEGEKGWHFLTGQESEIKKLASEVGFKYKYDADQKQYAHGAVVFVLTPDAKISRYLYGIAFQPRDVKLGLLEATSGKIGNIAEKFLMFCYHYDPKGKKYALYAVNLMKGAAAVTIVGLAFLVLAGSGRKRKKQSE